MSLPWERFEPLTPPDPNLIGSVPSEPEPVATAPVQQRPSPAQSAQQADISDQIERAVGEAMSGLTPWLQKQALDYAKDYAMGRLTGRDVSGFPTITTQDKKTGKEVIVADARNRSFRTFVQGIGIDLLFAFVGLLAMVSSMDVTDKTAWTAFGVLVLKTFVQTVVSYVSRLKIAPSGRVEGEQMKLLSVAVPKVT